MTVDEALSRSRGRGDGDPELFLDKIQEQLSNAERIRNETGHEFDEIEKHLRDIERLESLPKEIRTKITDLALNLQGYEKQRQDYLEGSRIISEEKYRTMDMYCDEIPEKLTTMEEQERYLNLIRNDMSKLEGEKGSIRFEKEEAEKKKKFLIRFTELAVAVLATVSIFLLVLSSYLGKSMLLPFMVMGALACMYAAYLVVSVKNCDYTIKKNEMLMGRAVELLNKVKIKYVNTVNALDYSYEKYKCNSHQELAYIWQGYLKEKEEEKKFRKNTGLVGACQDSLADTLTKAGFALPNMWIHQSEMLSDKQALRELKDVLTERHRKLKAQLEFNARQEAGMVSDLKAFVMKHPEYASVLGEV